MLGEAGLLRLFTLIEGCSMVREKDVLAGKLGVSKEEFEKPSDVVLSPDLNAIEDSKNILIRNNDICCSLLSFLPASASISNSVAISSVLNLLSRSSNVVSNPNLSKLGGNRL